MRSAAFALVLTLLPLAGGATAPGEGAGGSSTVAQDGTVSTQGAAVPPTRWPDGKAVVWSRAALSALRAHARPLPRSVPRDIDTWCPAYRNAGTAKREAFWVGLISALSKHESTYRPGAVGGGGKWFGLLQISPGTARSYGCRAGSGEALKNAGSNLSCALRIMAVTVPRDGVVSEGMRGVAADWGPFHSRRKRQDMMDWTRSQSYCQPVKAPQSPPKAPRRR